MHKSMLPFRYWFIAMHLLTSIKKSLSKELPHKKKEEPIQRGRSSQKKTKVLVMAESEIVESS
jgi:hypothetical protein